MKVFILISSLMLVHAAIHDNDEVVINGVRHQMEVLYENLIIPNTLCVDYITNNLYFRKNRTTISRFDLNTGKLRNMDGVTDVSAIAVDQETQDLYVGTVEGMYKYDPNTDNFELAGAAGVNIWSAYFKGVLYYNSRDTNTLYTFIDGESKEKVELDAKNSDDLGMKQLFVDNQDIYFSIDKVLYRQKIGEKAIVLYQGGNNVNAVTSDRNDNVYFSTSSGIYEVQKDSDTVKKIITIDECRGLAFDAENNIIFSDKTSIYRLRPDIEISEVKRKIYDVDTKIDNLEKKMDKQLSGILQILLNRTDSVPRSIHLDIRNIPVTMDDAHH